MLFEDQIEQASDALRGLSESVKESALWNKVSERFESFSPTFQKIIIFAAIGLGVLLVLGLPIAKYKSSADYITEFETRKDITQKIISFSKNKNSRKDAPKKYSISEFSNEVSNINSSRSVNVLPEQMNITIDRSKTDNPMKADVQAFRIRNTKLNIEQAAALVYSLKKLNKSLRIESLDFMSNPTQPEYFDTSIKVSNWSVAPIEDVLPKPEPDKPKKKSRRKKKGMR